MAHTGHGLRQDREMVRFSDWETHEMGEYDARTCFDRSVKIFVEAEIDMERARTLREWARHEFKRGDKENALNMWDDARDIFTDLGARMEVERMKDLPA
jgi:hypothetical protein